MVFPIEEPRCEKRVHRNVRKTLLNKARSLSDPAFSDMDDFLHVQGIRGPVPRVRSPSAVRTNQGVRRSRTLVHSTTNSEN